MRPPLLSGPNTDLMMTDTPAIGAKLPFLFSYRDTLFGNGFVVHVEAKNGRALCVHEEDGWWMYGVNPGGMAANGADPHAAHAAFRKTFSDVLLDIAKDTRSFDEFRAQVEAFFEATNAGYEPEWREAAAAVRAGRVSRGGFSVAPADSPRSVAVTLKSSDNVSAIDNVAALKAQLAQAA